MGAFEEYQPSKESYWRAIILFGQNAASYKFSLGQSLLELAALGKTSISLDDLAVPFAKHIVAHIRKADKQGQRPTGQFLEACRQFSRGESSLEKLHTATVQYGFQNVIDAFHVVNRAAIPTKFFVDERAKKRGITLTDELLSLKDSVQFVSLPIEVDARWKLVETAWELGVSRNLLEVKADDADELLYVIGRDHRRYDITSCRDALNGYQKGKCFYCFRDITIGDATSTAADIDHFFPWSLSHDPGIKENINGVWNLVLACKSCNRGVGGKAARVPSLHYLDRLQRRNEFLISSHHPLRDTLIKQMGLREVDRTMFLQARDREAYDRLIYRWSAAQEEVAAF